MKTYTAVITFLLFLLIVPAHSLASMPGDLRVSLIQGDVQVRYADASDWVPASINMPLMEGDGVWVPEGGRLEIQFADGTCLRLDEWSSLEVLRIGRDASQFYLAEGHAYIHFRGDRDSLLQLDTPASSVRAYGKVVFRTDVNREGDTDISVYSGWVDVESERRRTRVDRDNMLSLSGDYAELLPLGPVDEWERWNSDRDESIFERTYGTRYLPNELDAYANDLDRYGRWVYTDDYGYVWTPAPAESAGWAPYQKGRWAWIGGDYVWISYEPWGWAPYHYGRWAFISSHGWCWVPPASGDVFWGPGYVAWVNTPSYVAWVPLAPGEVYYGYGHYGRHSVNILTINIGKTVINHEYRNVRARHGVTVMSRNIFIRGGHAEERVKENPFLRHRISIGRPDIKPQRHSFMPVVREVPSSRRPPEQVRSIRVPDLKRERPLAKEPGKPDFSRRIFPKGIPGPIPPAGKKASEERKTPARHTQPFGEERRTGERLDQGGRGPAFKSPQNVQPVKKSPEQGRGERTTGERQDRGVGKPVFNVPQSIQPVKKAPEQNRVEERRIGGRQDRGGGVPAFKSPQNVQPVKKSPEQGRGERTTGKRQDQGGGKPVFNVPQSSKPVKKAPVSDRKEEQKTDEKQEKSNGGPVFNVPQSIKPVKK